MVLDDLLHDLQDVLRSRVGRSLVVSVLGGLLAVQAVLMVPFLLHLQREQVRTVIRTEAVRIDALLSTQSAAAVADQVRTRPLLLGVVVRDPSGNIAASAGYSAFDVVALAGDGLRVIRDEGVADVGFDVQRREGAWRVLMRCHTGPAEQAVLGRMLGVVVLGIVAVLLGVALTVIGLRRNVLEPLEHRAKHDSLTGLPNRACFDEKLRGLLAACEQSGDSAALLFIDLDRFKDFNDNFGHPQGDALLSEIARRLQDSVAADCVVARLGGDEFAALLPSVRKGSDARAIAERLLVAIARPYRYNQFHFQLSASIGVAMLPEHGATPADAQRNADIAMYVSKRAGRARVTLFDTPMSQAVSRRKQVEDWLRVALEQNELVVHYQPKLSMDGLRVVGAEALLRWTRYDGTKVLPGEFIPVAEESGLIVPLGRWVLREVLEQIRLWREQGFEAPRISVNVSANQFLDENFLGSFVDILEQSGMPATALDLEITESALITTPEHAVSVLGALRERGVTLSLDDFGTGYSSLSYLKRFPVNTIKIDHGFVADLAESEDSAKLVNAVIRMTHSLGMLFVAEGVETDEQLVLLREWGCDQYQGHVTSAAIGAEPFRQFCLARASTRRQVAA